MPKFSASFVTKSAVIAAMYVSLSLILQPVTFGPVQFRAAEALTMLPFIMAEGVFGVTVGCLITNLFSPYGIYDVVFGTLATLIASLLTYKIKNKWLAALPPVLVNAAVLPLLWHFLGSGEAYYISLLSFAASEAAVVFALGVPLVMLLKKSLPSVVTNPKFLDKPHNTDNKI